LKTWVAVCALLAGGSAAVAWAPGLSPPAAGFDGHPLAWDAASWPKHPWTLWTAAWVHTSIGSLAGNLLALAALAVAGAALGAGTPAAAALLAGWPLGTLGLLAWPEVTRYGGLGGPIHAAAAVLGLHMAGRADLQPFSAFLFGALALKLLAERAWAQPVAFDPSWGFNVVYAAHATGMLAGVACGGVAALLARQPRRGQAL
jgi:hypothetical protein